MQYSRLLIAIAILIVNLAPGSVNASGGPLASNARPLDGILAIPSGPERLDVEAAAADVAHVRYPSISVGGVAIHGVSEDALERGRSAVQRMTQSGFDLPVGLDVFIHPSRHGCSRAPGDLERSGVYVRSADGVNRVHVCGPDFVLFHELGHVWEVANMSDADRATFLAIRDADYWSGPEWARAAGEHLADVIAWAMLDGEVIPSRTLPNDDVSLVRAFDLITQFARNK